MHQLWKPNGPNDVFVYRNLQNNMWSVRASAGWNRRRVIFHATYIQLAYADFRVSEAGRQRVLKEKRKNVHAGVEGRLVRLVSPYEPRYDVQPHINAHPYNGFNMLGVDEDPATVVTYNPYRSGFFHYKESREMVLYSRRRIVTLWADGIVTVS